jgi:hypothetical protein
MRYNQVSTHIAKRFNEQNLFQTHGVSAMRLVLKAAAANDPVDDEMSIERCRGGLWAIYNFQI